MGWHALSLTKRARNDTEEKNKLYIHALARYQELQGQTGEKSPAGFRTVCTQISAEYRRETGVNIPLSHATLRAMVNGRVLRAESNAAKSWINAAEADQIIEFAIECVEWGHPLDQARLAEHANEIIKARLPTFPGVGKNWPARFIEKHSNRLHTYHAAALDTLRGQAVNPANNKLYFRIIGNLAESGNDGEPLDPKNVYTMDEIGVTEQSGVRKKVIGRKGKKMQYQNRGGGREITTIIFCICADRTVVPPIIIFKAKAYGVSWLDGNPANASVGYSKKGWVTNQIGVAWAKHFNLHTRAKANGHYRSLTVDSHVSHCSRAFLKYCRENCIHVPAYVAHGTHIYSVLNVIVFSPLKKAFGEERDKHYRETGERLNKDTFALIWAWAQLGSVTEDLVKTGFRKTGLWPVDPTVITEDMLAPSKDTSWKAFTPIEPSAPVKILRDSELGFLVSSSPIKPSAEPPELRTATISPVKLRPTGNIAKLLEREPVTNAEKELRDAIRVLHGKSEAYKEQALQTQATGVLQQMYCGQLHKKLLAKEERGKRKKGWLASEGLPVLMTGDEHFKKVVEHKEAQKEEEQKKRERKAAKEKQAQEIVIWEQEEGERKGRNEKRKEALNEAVLEWKKERADAKSRRVKLKDWEQSHPKPKAKDAEYALEPAVPRPKIKKVPEPDDGYEEIVVNEDELSSDDDDD
ncbi:hypothetical protein D9758_015752 [Tetrapyrgos nigripes]|uniref:DDE-1 domain-containing protein n=1 Tax=Tetrapyrgos nigripes TaxID=182062 RepID=A0A8H5CB88_9AGAR|nr:hypothetical protein D9758_015752 [Tetrapyrgos nigripes]